MSKCYKCGTDFSGQFCPTCGSPSPVYQNFVQQPQYTPTSAWGWFGWLMLLGFLPIIGHIIMLLCARDPSAKNFAKMQLVLMAVVLVGMLALLILSMLGVASMGAAYN